MNFFLRVPLNTSVEQRARLIALQVAFARVCNALAPTVQKTGVWNRVALHHLMYRSLRERFPEMGSQMVCNAIYAVSRTSRLLFQHASSPLNLSRLAGKPLPLLRFADSNPVYFDRHTLSLKGGQLSLYTLDGRMRFALALQAGDEANFNEKKLKEIILASRPDGVFELAFQFSDEVEDEASATPVAADLGAGAGAGGGADAGTTAAAQGASRSMVPEYVMVEEVAEVEVVQ